MFKIQKLLLIVWLLAFVTLGVLTQFLRSESTRFYGIADNSEQAISFSYPVEIVQNLVIEGAEVKQGQPILEVRRPDLNAKITFIDDQIRAATAVHGKNAENMRARLDELTAKRSADLAELDVQIETLRARQALNEKLLKDISGSNVIKPLRNPIATEMQGLKEQRKYLQDSFDTKIMNLKSQLESENGRFDVQIAESQDRKIDLERQLSDLSVRAKFDGRIGSVNFKPGDQIAPFETILTVHGNAPLFVKGYIHENVYNQLHVGQEVWVQSYGSSNNDEIIIGEVESMGSRIVEYPMRLKKNQFVSAWGREAIVRLRSESSLLMGQKVVVFVQSPDQTNSFSGSSKGPLFGTISNAGAMTRDTDVWRVQDTLPIVSKVSGLVDMAIEASGVVISQGSEEYLVISDETGSLPPRLLVMNSQGEVTGAKTIAGDADIDDMESISRDGNTVYVSASLSHNKAGKLKRKRCQLLRLEPENDHFRVGSRLNLCDVLTQVAKNSKGRDVRHFLNRAIARKAIDVESHVISEGRLYLGFKAPLDDQGNTVIIQIDDLDGLFAGRPARGRIWRRLSLLDPLSGAPAHLSDMRLEGDQLWLLGVSRDKGRLTSHLWSYNWKTERISVVRSFPELRAEGMSEQTSDGRRVLVFDGDGKSYSRLIKIQENG